MIFSVVWFCYVADAPAKHPRISKSELEYILSSLGDSVSKNHDQPLPVCDILTSIPFMALLILHFGNLFGLFFLITATPRFITEVLGFKLSNAGFISSIPYLMRIIFGFLFGWIGDYQRNSKVLSVTVIRKFYCIFCEYKSAQTISMAKRRKFRHLLKQLNLFAVHKFAFRALRSSLLFQLTQNFYNPKTTLPAHIIPGLLLIALCFVGFDIHACIAIITLSLGFNGAATVTSLQNSQDLAPNFAGSLYAVINFVGTSSGFIAPLLVAHFTGEHVRGFDAVLKQQS
jgi:ACS family sodium-dependent inorganic phosphate cotransporter